MGVLPEPVERILDAALVAELTVVGARGEPVTSPLIPLYDGERILMTSSVLFSRKLEHMKRDPRVAVSVTDAAAVPGLDGFRPVTVQGDARIVEEDLHEGWFQVLPLWRRKEPVIDKLVRQRFALPLFFERSIIEITPRRSLVWAQLGGEPEIEEVAA